MEFPSYSTPELSNKPDESGDKNTSKKNKKKSVKIPLPVTKSDSLDKQKDSKTSFGDLFDTKKHKTVKFPLPITKSETVAVDNQGGDIDKSPNSFDQANEVIDDNSKTSENAPIEANHTLEGEFADEAPFIISRAESLFGGVKQPEPSNDATKDEGSVQEPQVSSRRYETAPEVSNETIDPNPNLEPMVPSSKFESTNNEQVVFASEVQPASNEALNSWNSTNNEGGYSVPTVHGTEQTTGKPVVSRQEMEREVYYAKKRGVSRGVMAGGIFGWVFGRRSGRRSAEATSAKVIQAKEQEIKDLTIEQARDSERIIAVGRELEDLRKELSASGESNTRQFNSETSQAIQSETTREFTKKAATETQPEKSAEKHQSSTENQPEIEENYTSVPGHRVETSSWHRYEVDEKTGKLIDNPKLTYGEAFKNEQKQERLHHNAVASQIATPLGHTVMSASNPHLNSVDQKKDFKKQESKPTSKGAVVSVTEIKQQIVHYTKSPIIWIAALALVLLIYVIFG